MSNETSVPDLLRRFVPTPHICDLSSGESCVRLETNDPSIVTAMRSVTAPLSNETGRVTYSWKLIRDDAAPCGGREITILSSGTLCALLLGTGTVMAIDRERREVLGFIATDVSANEFVTSCLPLIMRLFVTIPMNAHHKV